MSTITESKESPEWRSFCQYSTLRPRGTNFDGFLLKLTKSYHPVMVFLLYSPIAAMEGKDQITNSIVCHMVR